MKHALLGFLFFVVGCSSSAELPERVSELTDDQILDICEPVERQTDVQCGEGADAFVIEETPGSRECAEALKNMRESETEACRLVANVVACQQGDVCLRFDDAPDNPCHAECPERQRCWDLAPAACENDTNCELMTGQKWNETDACYTNEDAYCMPTGYGCSAAFTNVIDDAGSCWLMSGICALPDGWTHEEPGVGSCPYTGEPGDVSCGS